MREFLDTFIPKNIQRISGALLVAFLFGWAITQVVVGNGFRTVPSAYFGEAHLSILLEDRQNENMLGGQFMDIFVIKTKAELISGTAGFMPRCQKADHKDGSGEYAAFRVSNYTLFAIRMRVAVVDVCK